MIDGVTMGVDCEQSLIFIAKLLHAKPKHASGEAACREKRGRKPRRKISLFSSRLNP